MCNNNLLSQIAFGGLLLVTIISQRFQCEAYTIKTNNAKSLPSPPPPYPKAGLNNVNSKLPVELQPSILSDYYNSLIFNSDQYLRRLPVNNWPQNDFIPLSNFAEEYDNEDEYYNDDNSDQIRLGASDIYYGNDAYHPEGWFNGPVIYDTPDSNVQNDEPNELQLSNLMMSYLFDQFDKLNKQKELSEKRSVTKSQNSEITTKSSIESVKSSVPTTMTTNVTPKKLTSKQFRLFQRGQKEYPLLRPASDNKDKKSEKPIPEWPTELDEKDLTEEDSLMSLKQKAQSRTVRDVLTAQLDNLKKEGPKMH